jgi:zinc protease
MKIPRTLQMSALAALWVTAMSVIGAQQPARGTTPRAAPASTPASTAPLTAPIPVDPQITTGRFANGLRYYIRANKKPEKRAELRLVVNAGSILEERDQAGLAHFVEHMAFNGTKHFPKQETVKFLESIGMRFGPSVNAFTSFDETVYMLEVPTDKPEVLDKAFLILEDWAHNVSFDPAEIDKERGVITEEWRLRRGAGARKQDKQLPIKLNRSRKYEPLPIRDK